MSLNTQLSTTAQGASLDSGGLGPLLNNGYLKIYSGAQPANANAAITGTKLAEFRFGATALNTATTGSTTAKAIANVVGLVSGIAGYCIGLQSDGTTVVFMGSVGTSGANLVIPTLSITVGDTISISSLTLSVPGAGA